jgi:hypothetical protein
MAKYTVKQGDCIMSIAEERGYRWETIWNHPDNAPLKQLRRDPNIIFPGDVVTIPDKAQRTESAPTDQRSKFVKRVVKAQVRLRLLDLKRLPRANVAYIATVDGVNTSGQTDGDGYLKLTVKPDAREVKLKVTEGSKTDSYTIPLGSVDPLDEISGVQHRLTNLGYACASEQGTMGDTTKTAVRAFQKEMNLKITGELDDSTRQKLKELHGT